jgi:hypothetical protein
MCQILTTSAPGPARTRSRVWDSGGEANGDSGAPSPPFIRGREDGAKASHQVGR